MKESVPNKSNSSYTTIVEIDNRGVVSSPDIPLRQDVVAILLEKQYGAEYKPVKFEAVLRMGIQLLRDKEKKIRDSFEAWELKAMSMAAEYREAVIMKFLLK